MEASHEVLFLSKRAARVFFEHFKKRNLELIGCTDRALRRTTLQGEGAGYLIADDADALGGVAELHLVDEHHGQPKVIWAQSFVPSERNGPASQTIWFRTPTLDRDPLYVLTHDGDQASP